MSSTVNKTIAIHAPFLSPYFLNGDIQFIKTAKLNTQNSD